MLSMLPTTVLVRNAEVGGHREVDVRVGPERIEEIGPKLTRQPGEEVVDAAGGAVIPGLHDHHVHLRAAVAARRSIDTSQIRDATAFDQLIAFAAAAAGAGATTGRWVRATGWDEHRAGHLDRRRLDVLTGQVPTRVQHRSGAMWVLNSAALSALGAERCDLDGIERDEDGMPTGRLLRVDGWLAGRLASMGAGQDRATLAAGVVEFAASCSELGITGFTDATPGRDLADAEELAELSEAGAYPQRLTLMAPVGLRMRCGGRVSLGPVKLLLDDGTLPTAQSLAGEIARAHSDGRGAAVHCVTAEQLVVAVSAFEQAGPPLTGTADRIEHAGVVPPGYAERLACRGLAVVTQPGFIWQRGDQYALRVKAPEQWWLYPCASLLRAGVSVAASSDVPFGPANPWLAIATAISRRTSSGAVLGAAERVSAAQALRLYLAAPGDLRRIRTIAPGEPGDVCILRAPLQAVLSDPLGTEVAATVIGGNVITIGTRQ
jgi:predicted amidohydrolase YtcJ